MPAPRRRSRCREGARRLSGAGGRLAGTPSRAWEKRHARPGEAVTEGQPLFTLLTDDEHRIERALESLDGGYDIESGGAPYQPTPLVIDRIG